MVAAKDDFFAGRMEKWRPVGLSQVCDLTQVRAVDFTGVNLHIGWRHQVLGKVIAVFLDFFCRFGATGAENDLCAVGTKKATAVVAQIEGDLALVGAVEVHGPEFEVAGAVAGEQNFIALGAEYGFRIVAGGVSKLFGDIAFQVGNIDIEGFKNGPQVFAAGPQVGRMRAGSVAFVGTGIQDMFPVGHKVTSRWSGLSTC